MNETANHDRTGKVQTVTGLLDPEQLGVTLMHEHLFDDTVDAYYVEPEETPPGCDGPVSLANRWWVNTHFASNRDNLVLDELDEAVYELGLFKDAGGQSIVEVSTVGLRRPDQARLLRDLAAASGVNIIMGTGWYVASALPEHVSSLSEDDMISAMLRDINEGMDGTDAKAGLIGEIGTSAPVADVERRAVRAAGAVQGMTGVPIEIHPPLGDDDLLLEMVKTVQAAGADLEKVILCHQDSFSYSREAQLEALQAGCTLEFDTFGYTWLLAGLPPGLVSPSDPARIEHVEFFIEQGYGKQLVLSHDLIFKVTRATYGGHGYGHIPRMVVPQMRQRGFSQDVIDDLLIHNPARVLAFGAPVSAAASSPAD